MNQMNHLLLSTLSIIYLTLGNSLFRPFILRERREHRVFSSLLTCIPGLEDRLMNSSPEEIRMIGDLVRHPCHLLARY